MTFRLTLEDNMKQERARNSVSMKMNEVPFLVEVGGHTNFEPELVKFIENLGFADYVLFTRLSIL